MYTQLSLDLFVSALMVQIISHSTDQSFIQALHLQGLHIHGCLLYCPASYTLLCNYFFDSAFLTQYPPDPPGSGLLMQNGGFVLSHVVEGSSRWAGQWSRRRTPGRGRARAHTPWETSQQPSAPPIWSPKPPLLKPPQGLSSQGNKRKRRCCSPRRRSARATTPRAPTGAQQPSATPDGKAAPPHRVFVLSTPMRRFHNTQQHTHLRATQRFIYSISPCCKYIVATYSYWKYFLISFLRSANLILCKGIPKSNVLVEFFAVRNQ